VHPSSRSTTVVLAATTLVLVISACSSSKGSSGPAAVSVPSQNTSTSGKSTPASAPASTGDISQMSMRIVNLFTPQKKAGPALDIYDVQLTGQKATPIVTNVAYGGVSKYFKPHLEGSSSVVQLFALPAGEDPVAKKSDSQGLGGAQDDGSHPQITFVLTADTGEQVSDAPLAGLSFSPLTEKGTNNGGKSPVAPAAPSGKGELLADTHAAPNVSIGLYLMIDAACDEPLNGDPAKPGVPYIFAVDGQAPVSSFAVFATSPGTHQVSVVPWSDSTSPTCAQLTDKQGGTSVDVTDGQQIETFVYGTSDTDLHLALAPIAP
jgi:hypothetical protein